MYVLFTNTHTNSKCLKNPSCAKFLKSMGEEIKYDTSITYDMVDMVDMDNVDMDMVDMDLVDMDMMDMCMVDMDMVDMDKVDIDMVDIEMVDMDMVDQRNVTQCNLSRSWMRWTSGHGHSGPRKQSISMVHYWVRHAKCTWSSCCCLHLAPRQLLLA